MLLDKNIQDSIVRHARNNFVYQYDPKFFDLWRIPVEDIHGKIKGDCEDYALWVAYQCTDMNMTRFKQLLKSGEISFYYCKTKGEGTGHAVVKVGDRWTDNWTKDWVTEERMRQIHDVKRKYPWWLVLLKLKLGKLYTQFILR